MQRVIVNPVVAQAAHGKRVLFVEDGAASGSGERFVDVDTVTAALETGLDSSNQVTGFASCSGGQHLLDKSPSLRLFSFSFW